MRLQVYLWKTLWQALWMALLVLGALMLLSEILQVADLVADHFGWGSLLLLALSKLPALLYEVLPATVTLGVMMGLGAMAQHQELTVLRAAGMSLMRLYGWVLTAVLSFWLVVAGVTEGLLPLAHVTSENLLAQAKKHPVEWRGGSKIWVKNDHSAAFIQQVLDESHLSGVRLMRWNEGGQLTQLLEAKTAQADQGRWLLKGVWQRQLRYQQDHYSPVETMEVTTQNLADLRIDLPVGTDFFQGIQLAPKFLSVWDVYLQWQLHQQHQLDAVSYDAELWKRLSLPLLLCGLVALIFPLLLGSGRSVPMGQRVFIGVVLGLIFFLLNQLMTNYVQVYRLDGRLGIALPVAIFALFALGRLLWLNRKG